MINRKSKIHWLAPPMSYFIKTRLNRLAYVGYNGLVEWLPALLLGLWYSKGMSGAAVVLTLLASYAAFICIYEIGYICNDSFSELYESDPRGRLDDLALSKRAIVFLVAIRLAIFGIITSLLGVGSDPLWIGFYFCLIATFVLHNILPSNQRIGTFYALSTFRFYAPLILLLNQGELVFLLPIVLINNSLYRTKTYILNKSAAEIAEKETDRSKIIYFLTLLPLNCLVTFLEGSFLPLVANFYMLLVWAIYFVWAFMSGESRHRRVE